jgi:hypothetical protein
MIGAPLIKRIACLRQVLCSKAAWEQANNHEAVARAKVAAAPAGVHHLKGVLGKMEVFHCTAASATFRAERPDLLPDSPLTADITPMHGLLSTPPPLSEADEEDGDFQLVAGTTAQSPALDGAAGPITAGSDGGSSHGPGAGQPSAQKGRFLSGEGVGSRRVTLMETSTQTDWSSSWSAPAGAGAADVQDGSSNQTPCNRPEPRSAILSSDGDGIA